MKHVSTKEFMHLEMIESTIERAQFWINVIDGTQGTRRSMSLPTRQQRLDEYASLSSPAYTTNADALHDALMRSYRSLVTTA